MLGFLRGIEKGVAREGAAQRDYHGTVLSSKENHLDRLLAQIKYNQQLKRQDRAYDRSVFESDRTHQYRQDRDVRQDFVTDRAYDRGVLESDRTHQYRQDRARTADAQFDAVQALRESAEQRAGDVHDFNYGIDGYMRRRAEREEDIHDFNYGEGGYMPMRRQVFQNELDEYAANQGVRDVERRLKLKQGEYNLGQGWQEYLEDKSLSQDLMRAQINNLNRPRPSSTSRTGPTWLQTRDITVEGLAPVVLKHLKGEGESAVWPWDKQAQFWPPGFQADRPFVSEDPNAVTQTSLLRQAGAHLIEELMLRGTDPNLAMQMVPFYWDQILDTKGSDVLKRLNRASKAAGYDDLELRKIYRDTVYEGAMNYMRFKKPDRPAGVDMPDADKLLDTPIR